MRQNILVASKVCLLEKLGSFEWENGLEDIPA